MRHSLYAYARMWLLTHTRICVRAAGSRSAREYLARIGGAPHAAAAAYGYGARLTTGVDVSVSLCIYK